MGFIHPYPTPNHLQLWLEMTSVSDEETVTLMLLKQKMHDFAQERDWEQFHSPRNLLLALVGEVGELSEIFQWKGEVPKGLGDWKEEEIVHLGEELSTSCSTLFASLTSAASTWVKLPSVSPRLNALKYPAPFPQQ